MSYTLVKNLTTVNYNVFDNRDIKYIVIHYTGNTTDKAASNGNYFKSVRRGASAHYFVDETQVVQVVEDKNASWAVGKNYGSNNLFGQCTNANSINIEMCSTNGKIADKTFNNTVDLTKNLMKKYNIPVSNVVRHYDVCSKQCPGWSGWGTKAGDNGELWTKFKNSLITTSANTSTTNNISKPSTSSNKTKMNTHLRDLQGSINDDGIAALVKDGLYGPKTNSAISKVVLSVKKCKANGKWRYMNTVAWVQCRVGTKPDGLYGNGTAEAVKKYQKKKGLVADGIAGSKTIKAILKDMGVNC